MQMPELIDRYAAGAELLGQSIAGLTRAELNAFPVPNTWSIQQIVLHMLDSDLIGSDRMKRIIAEDNPTLIGYDETAFAKRLYYDQLDTETACEIFRQNRLLTSVILRNLPAETFSRQGTHSEHGAVTLAGMLENYVGHLDHHLKFIQEKRRLLGKS